MTDVVAAWLSIGVVILLASAAFGYRMRLNRAANSDQTPAPDAREQARDYPFVEGRQ